MGSRVPGEGLGAWHIWHYWLFPSLSSFPFSVYVLQPRRFGDMNYRTDSTADTEVATICVPSGGTVLDLPR